MDGGCLRPRATLNHHMANLFFAVTGKMRWCHALIDPMVVDLKHLG